MNTIVQACSNFFASSSQWFWVLNIFFVIFFTLLARYFQIKFFAKYLMRAEKEHKIWDDALIFAINKPLGYLIWLLGFTFAVLLVKEHVTNKAIFSWVQPVRLVGTILLLSWSTLRFLTRAEENLVNPPKGKEPINKTTALALNRLFKIGIMIITVIIIMQALNIPVTGLLALGSAGTLIVGIASKDLLANFFGGLMVFMDRPFSVGDWICSPDKSIEGTVEHIGWRLTKIRTFSKRPLYVPNSVFLTISIENPSRMTNRQIKQVLGLRYQDAAKIPEIVSSIEKMLKSHPDIDTKQTTFVALHEFSESSLDCLIYCFTKTTQWVPFMHIRQDVYVKIADIVEQHGAQIAFPTRILDVPNDILLK